MFHKILQNPLLFPTSRPFQVGIYQLKVNNRNTGTRCEICSKLRVLTLNIINFEHISYLVLVFLLLILNM